MKRHISRPDGIAKVQIDELLRLKETIRQMTQLVHQRHNFRSVYNNWNARVNDHFQTIFKRLLLCQNEVDFSLSSIRSRSSPEPKMTGTAAC